MPNCLNELEPHPEATLYGLRLAIDQAEPGSAHETALTLLSLAARLPQARTRTCKSSASSTWCRLRCRLGHNKCCRVHLDADMSRCYGAMRMSKVRTTLTIDESVMKSVKMRAVRTGRGDSQVIEESLRRDMGLDLLERLWERNDIPARDAEALAVEAQHRTRRRQR